MFDDAQESSDTPTNDGDQPAELDGLERRLILDGSIWRADVPDDAELAKLASTLPGDTSMTKADGELGDPVLDTHAVSSTAIDIPRRPYRQPPALIAVAATMIVVLLLALVLTTFAQGQTKKGLATTADSTVTATADDTSTATDVPTTTAASTSTVGSGDGTGGATAPTATPPGYVAPLNVTGLSLTVDRTSVNGVCQDDNFFTFTLTISVSPGSPLAGSASYHQNGLVSYTVVPSDSTVQQISSSVAFGNSDNSETTTFGEDIRAQYGDGTVHWVQVQITSPNAVSSQQISFEANCVRQVTSATASVTPNVWNAPCARTQAFTFTFTITLTPGPPVSVTFAHNRSFGFAEWYPATETFNNFTGDSIAYSVTGTLYSPTAVGADGSNGTYWQSITVTSPNTVASNQATVTEAC